MAMNTLMLDGAQSFLECVCSLYMSHAPRFCVLACYPTLRILELQWHRRQDWTLVYSILYRHHRLVSSSAEPYMSIDLPVQAVFWRGALTILCTTLWGSADYLNGWLLLLLEMFGCLACSAIRQIPDVG